MCLFLFRDDLRSIVPGPCNTTHNHPSNDCSHISYQEKEQTDINSEWSLCQTRIRCSLCPSAIARASVVTVSTGIKHNLQRVSQDIELLEKKLNKSSLLFVPSAFSSMKIWCSFHKFGLHNSSFHFNNTFVLCPTYSLTIYFFKLHLCRCASPSVFAGAILPPEIMMMMMTWSV